MDTDKSNKSSDKYSSAGFTSKSVLKNLGFIFLGLIGLAVLIILALLLRLLKRKFPIFNKVYIMLSRRLFFNMIIRSIMESYLKLCISTFISIKDLSFDDKN
jgi:hypothetical protein